VKPETESDTVGAFRQIFTDVRGKRTPSGNRSRVCCENHMPRNSKKSTVRRTSGDPGSAVGIQNETIEWLDPAGKHHIMLATTDVLEAKLYEAIKHRKANHYIRQRNYHGQYYFGQVSNHVWHESLLEASVLQWLDLNEEIFAIAAQPMKLTFADGSIHYPDYFALHGDRRQVLYDVKPLHFQNEKALAQFEKTRRLCKKVGWEYEVHSEHAPQVRVNLDWIGAFRHPNYHPDEAATRRLLAAMDSPLSVGAAAVAIGLPTLAAARSAIYHLVAIRTLRMKLTHSISDATMLERNALANH
jgi:hypothetical protein